jgi:hypothetical protein
MPRSAPIILLLASLAVPAAASAGGSGQGHSSRDSRRDAYVLSVGNTMMSDNVSFDDDERMHERRSDPYLWFRRGGKAWRVTDAATLEKAESLFAGLRALEPEQEQLQIRQEALEEEERELDRQEEGIDRLVDLASGDDDDEGDEDSAPAPAASDADLQELRGRLRELHDRQRELASRERELDEIERSLDAREDAIEHEAEAKLWKLIDASIQSGVARPD